MAALFDEKTTSSTPSRGNERSNLICSHCGKEANGEILESVQWKLDTLRKARHLVDEALQEHRDEAQSKSQALEEQDICISKCQRRC